MSILVALLAVTTSCETEEHCNKQKCSEIKFGTASTRAKVESLDDILDFGVYAQMSETPDEDYETQSDIVYTHILEGAKVARTDKDSNDWDYEDEQYWVNGRTFHFFAYWPSSLETRIYDDSYQLDYKTPVTADDDLLADYYSIYIDPNFSDYPVVDFTFDRLLTKVRLELEQDWLKNQYDKFWIKSVKLENVKADGTLTTSRFDKEGNWYFGEEKFSKEVKYGGDQGLFIKNQTISPWGGAGVGLHLIPQPIALNEIALTLEYDYQQGGQNDQNAEIKTNVVRASIPAGEWKAGNTYTYKVKLYKDNLIVFSNIAVELWGEPLTGGTIIIK